MEVAGGIRSRAPPPAQQLPRTRRYPMNFSFAQDEDGPSTIVPDPHDTEKDDTIIESNGYIDDDGVEEEILRPNLGNAAGVTRTQEMKSLLESFLSLMSANSEKKSGKRPKFHGVTEETSPTNHRDNSIDNPSPRDIASTIEALGNGIRIFDGWVDKKGSMPKKQLRRNWKPIHLAAYNGKVTLINAYIERGADVNTRDNDGWTALVLAAQNGHLEACRALLNHGADVNAIGDDSRTAMLQACISRHIDVVKLLLSNGADPSCGRSKDGSTPFFMAIAVSMFEEDNGRSLEIARILLEAGADPNTPDHRGSYPLMHACAGNGLPQVEFLLANGGDLNKRGVHERTCIQVAAYEANPEIIMLLLQHGANVNDVCDELWTPLHYNNQFDKELTLDTARILLREGADIDAVADTGVTPLYLAVQSKRLDVVQFLLDQGAQSLDQRTDVGFTALVRAVGHDDLDMVNLLLNYGARTDILYDHGYNIVHIAAMHGPEVFKRILESGADADLESNDGRAFRPLHVASQNDREEIAIMLLDHGVMP